MPLYCMIGDRLRADVHFDVVYVVRTTAAWLSKIPTTNMPRITVVWKKSVTTLKHQIMHY